MTFCLRFDLSAIPIIQGRTEIFSECNQRLFRFFLFSSSLRVLYIHMTFYPTHQLVETAHLDHHDSYYSLDETTMAVVIGYINTVGTLAHSDCWQIFGRLKESVCVLPKVSSFLASTMWIYCTDFDHLLDI